ncbi:hypothetical protein M8J76_000354 [Diaphorina citri]|jgi:hypothetical protein|nr:hypothetical protein M8J75_000615 [Diaphorina citri]KAI5748579.1 hypothetical protein M8J76_000354 [Diaphorina citri]KAI5755048.1 hypothetical protein M8J77_013606 [Diaphorina citri]
MNFNTTTNPKNPIDENGGQAGNRLADGEQGQLVPPTDIPNPQNTENIETLLMELSSPSSVASDAESVVTLSGQIPKDNRKRVDLSSSPDW